VSIVHKITDTVRIGFIKAFHPIDVQWHKPLAFGYLASYLDHFSTVPVKITLLDNIDNIDQIDVLGISCTSQDYAIGTQIASTAKKNNPSIITVLGGHHISHLPKTLADYFDVGIVGEGEETFNELIAALYADGLSVRAKTLHQIHGLVFRSGKHIIQSPLRMPITPLDRIPHPIRSQGETPYLLTSRGCPYRCAFCGSTTFWDKVRYFSAEYVVAEIEEIITQFPHNRHIAIWDDLLIANHERFLEIVELLEARGLTEKLQFSFTVRANLIDNKLCRILNKLNVPATAFGAESGSDRILKLMNKGSTVETNQHALDCLYRNGIPASCSFIVGWPTETESEARQSFEFALRNLRQGKLSAGISVNILMPIPGTTIWQWAVDHGQIDLHNMDWQRLAVFAAFRDSTAGSLDRWIQQRRENNSVYLAEETLPQERLYQIMQEYQHQFEYLQDRQTPLRRDSHGVPANDHEALEDVDGSEGYYTHERPEVAREVPDHAKHILDVGCGAGRLGAKLKKGMPDRVVVGVELDADACEKARHVLDEVHCADVENDVLPLLPTYFDCLILSDILEHLRDPWTTFKKLLSHLQPGATVLISLPNIRNFNLVKKLLRFGRWEYVDEGILDWSHFRFFTKREWLPFLTANHLSCRKLTYIGDSSEEAFFTGGGIVSDGLILEGIHPDELGELFATQLIYTCIYGAENNTPQLQEIVRFSLRDTTDKEGVIFGTGFGEEVDGCRWVGPTGTFYIPAASLAEGRTVSFSLSGSSLPHLSKRKLTVQVFYNDVRLETIYINDHATMSRIHIPLHPGNRDACIRIESDVYFRPSEKGQTPDYRKLAVVFCDLVMGDSNDALFGRGFYEEDNGGRWMGPEALLEIPSCQLRPNGAIFFQLKASLLDHMPVPQISVVVYYNDVPTNTIVIARHDIPSMVKLNLYPSDRSARIRLVADAFIRPCEAGLSQDQRLVSVRFSDLKIIN
jgi:radical SAM superfamily enzyme YgiQ (UPF0313 family)/SAM-dependent methyltransferase